MLIYGCLLPKGKNTQLYRLIGSCISKFKGIDIGFKGDSTTIARIRSHKALKNIGRYVRSTSSIEILYNLNFTCYRITNRVALTIGDSTTETTDLYLSGTGDVYIVATCV